MSLNNQMPPIMEINYWQKYTMNNCYSYELIEFYSLHQILTPLEKRTGDNETVPGEARIARRKNMLRAHQIC